MSVGPVQLLVLGFEEPDFGGVIGAELDKLRASGTVRVIDLLAVRKNADGSLETLRDTDLDAEQATEAGAALGALFGLGAGGEAGMAAGAELGAEAARDGHLFTGQRVPDIAAALPDNSAAAVVLLEHVWAAPLRDAVADAGGFPVADTWVRPADLVAVGLLAAES